jgi:ribose transport system permease protein
MADQQPGETPRALPMEVRALLFTRDWGILVLLFAVVMFFTAWNGTAFFSVDNALLIFNAAAITSVFAAGVAISAMGGVLDLSIPGTAAIAGVVAGRLINGGQPIPLALAAAVATGFVVGVFNGLVTLRGFNPLIVTIGTLSILQGIASVLAKGYTIPGLDSLSFMGTDRYWNIPAPVIITGVLYLLGSVFLTKTRHGIRLTAVGGNAEAARRVGISSSRYKVLGFILCAVFAAIGGLINTAYVTEANPFPTVGVVFDALTAVALGGISLEGGRGKLSKVLLGAIVLATISDGLTIASVGVYWVYVVTGVLLLGALILEKSVGSAISRRLLTKDLSVHTPVSRSAA